MVRICWNWKLNLSDGTNIELTLEQSVAALFGKGRVVTDYVSQGAYASGSVSGNSLNLDVVPESGAGLYSTSFDIISPPFEGNYAVFLANSRRIQEL